MQRAVILLSLLLASWFGFASAANKPVYTDSSQIIEATPAKSTFIIALPSNPSTGYSWKIKSYPQQQLKLIKQAYVPPKKQLIGGGGTETWLFSVKPSAFKNPGSGQIELIYQRPWENIPVKTQIFKIKISSR
ncbi:MAG: protease inhibitor I42 family protein [Coxiellaceae bacterium]|nr:MAG: protease inhibitor I42 family protein [Coxiellaceae bacterium]